MAISTQVAGKPWLRLRFGRFHLQSARHRFLTRGGANVPHHMIRLRFGGFHVQSCPSVKFAHGYDSTRGTRFWRYPFMTIFTRREGQVGAN